MRHLTATICVTLAVFLGSAGLSWGATYNFFNREINAIYVHTIAIIAVVIIGAMITRVYVSKRAVSVAKKQLGRSLVMWAVQGPFKNGAESMDAYKRALNLIFGEEKSHEYFGYILGHADSYNQRPDEWEETRISAITHGDLRDLELGRQLLSQIGLEKGSMEALFLNPDYAEHMTKRFEILDYHINLRRNPAASEKHLEDEKN